MKQMQVLLSALILSSVITDYPRRRFPRNSVTAGAESAHTKVKATIATGSAPSGYSADIWKASDIRFMYRLKD
jgi:hypothetical protein